MADLLDIADVLYNRTPPVTATIDVEIPYTLVRATVFELDESRVEERRRELEEWVEGIKFSAKLRGWSVG